MKKLLSLLLAIALAISLCATCFTMYALAVNGSKTIWAQTPTEQPPAQIQGKINGELQELLNLSTEQEKFPVSVELIDELNHETIEEQAHSFVGLTEEEFDALADSANGLNDEENKVFQAGLLETSNQIAAKRIELLVKYYSEYNKKFAVDNGISNEDIVEISSLIPTLYRVNLTKEQILMLDQNAKVLHLQLANDTGIYDFASNARTIIGGNTFINEGYTGSGIRVGLIEPGHPRLGTAPDAMGSE